MIGLTLLLAAATSTQESETPKDPTECEIHMSWGDIAGRNDTLMIVTQNQEQFDDGDTVVVAFFNDDWSIAGGDKLGEIKVESDEGWFSNEGVPMEHGFAIFSTFKSVSYAFDGIPLSLAVTRKGKTVDRLSMSGGYMKWLDFKSCRSKKVAVREEIKRKRELERSIPKDPFAQ